VHEDSVSPKLKEIIEATADAVVKRALRQHSAPPNSRLLNVKDACAYLCCARSTLFRLEAQGLLVPKRFGRKVLYDRDALDTYIKNGGAA
jgi:excisionase family DNA binding protein